VISFDSAKAVTIGGKAVQRIMHGDALIWEKKTAAFDEIVLFPETALATMLFSGNTYAIDAVTFSEPLASGDVIIFYFNGKTEEVQIGQLPGSGQLVINGDLVALASTGEANYQSFFVQFIGDTGNPTMFKVTKKVSA